MSINQCEETAFSKHCKKSRKEGHHGPGSPHLSQFPNKMNLTQFSGHFGKNFKDKLIAQLTRILIN